MRALRIAAAIGLVVALAGCIQWPQPAAGPDRSSFNPVEHTITPQTVQSLDVAWSNALDAGPAGDPVQTNAGVVVNAPHTVYGFAVSTGAQQWSHDAPDGGTTAPVFGDGDSVLASSMAWIQPPDAFGFYRSVTERLDAATGDPLGTVGNVTETAARRGAERATFSVTTVGRMQTHLNEIGVEHGDGSSWSKWHCGGPAEPNIPAICPVTLGRRWLYEAGDGINDTVGSYDSPIGNGLRGFDLTTPHDFMGYLVPSWFVVLDGTTAVPPVLAPNDALAFTGTDSGTVYAVDVASQSILWKGSVGSAVTGGLAYADGELYVPTAAGALFAFDASGCGAATCDAQWAISTGSKMTVRPAVAGGLVYTGSENGVVAAANANGCGSNLCNVLWSKNAGSAITGGPAVFDGQVYVGTADGHLVAYAPS